ncbi:MAG: phosphate/phosphite/phosphonate ABC transporter substrate-binding protein [Bacteroidetes bacterium]|nr:phosphate/phosphite/phosphonate ABC transporter substrate-binding protein [Bacteroidota bacterium]MBU1114663.1 phosphate/phosphite/phosphonate ABC transporter substrate-binding protein [Bacteroidota bacterium]MBU1798977.1 phosphate/phosphite/phosphonate ABC transporter substrate-binding protein [Bacteroidota bacterium]
MKYFLIVFKFVLITTIAINLGCTKQEKQDYSPNFGRKSSIQNNAVEYIFAVHPLHNSRHFFEVYQPLVDYINKNTKEFSIRLEASHDYAHFEEKLKNRKFHFALPNPYQSCWSIDYGYTIFGKMGDDDQFRGIIVVRKDSNINSIKDLRGAAISFPSATALAASMMPKYFLKTNGLDVEKDADCLYVGSQESSIMNVYVGKTKAGCTWAPPWESFIEAHPDVGNSLVVKWQTVPLINNGLVARNDVPVNHVKIFSDILVNLQKSSEGKDILKRINLSCFEAITQHEYSLRVNAFLQKYKNLFGLLPGMGENK